MKQVLLIDSHALIHRAFHALPPLTGPSGEPTGALYGLARILLKVLGSGRFTHVFAAFDRPEPTFRKEAYEAYKAQRPSAPDELVAQLEEARNLFAAFGVPVVERAGVEADDIIGTLAKKFSGKDARVTIFTGDLDALQLVRDPSVSVETFKKGVSETVTYDEAAVAARYGLPPTKLIDWKGLVGDASDNIPGVPGIGPKTAEKLLKEFSSVEEIFRSMPHGHPLAKKVLPYQKEALLAKSLATIKTDVPLPTTLAAGAFKGVPMAAVEEYFSRHGFASLARPPRIEPSEAPVPATESKNEEFPADVTFVPSAAWALAHSEPLRGGTEKVAYGWKDVIKELLRAKRTVTPPLFDCSVAGWMLDPDDKRVSREELFVRFGEKTNANDASLYRFLKTRLGEEGLVPLFESVEMPLVPVLASMESAGIGVERTKLQALQNEIAKELSSLAKAIYRHAGEVFNINSPSQVASILFEKLKLGTERKRKTSTGQRRTGKDILLELGDRHPIVPLLLDYREHFKILSSFVEPLAAAIGSDGRVHTSFLQTGTATGRLSSERPNLQNIPQGSRWSRPLRSAFEAKNGHSFVSFDYSQLELRLLAHACGDAELRRAFHNDEDIHRLTASRIFGVPLDRVVPSMRRTAKTLNFGVVYGMGAHAFASTSGLSFTDAKRFIEEYFKKFPQVREWQEEVKAEAERRGFVANENGRKRWFTHASVRGHMGEVARAAINMPLQSLGADIIKRAMIRTAELLEKERTHGNLLLSIHDELLFEIRDDMLSTLVPKIKTEMESAAKLTVPLIVDVTRGSDWGAMEPVL